MPRFDDVQRFYDVLRELQHKAGAWRSLADEDAQDGVPTQGVYFFIESGETRADGREPRVVRVGTHGVSQGSRATLWGRLAQHRGSLSTGGGNHRGSIFRLLVGEALGRRERRNHCDTWGSKRPTRQDRSGEIELECLVSKHIRHDMRFLCLPVAGESSRNNQRAYIERNCIALLSNRRPPDGCRVDPFSPAWLGYHSGHPMVQTSGLWNCRHVEGPYSPDLLSDLRELVRRLP